jgi:hypothetical protein
LSQFASQQGGRTLDISAEPFSIASVTVKSLVLLLPSEANNSKDRVTGEESFIGNKWASWKMAFAGFYSNYILPGLLAQELTWSSWGI